MRTLFTAVLSSDTAFSDFLRVELKYLGADASPYASGREYDFLIVDLDTARVPQGIPPEKCLTFSRTDPTADLQRPFLIEDFRNTVLSLSGAAGLPEGSDPHGADNSRPEELVITGADAFFGGTALKLTKTELALLTLLAEKSGELVSEELIRNTVFPGSTGNAVQVYVRYLRQKFEKFTRVRYIERLRGQGYRLLKDGLTITVKNGKGSENG